MDIPEQERQRLTERYSQMSDGELQQLFDDVGSLSEVAAHVLRSEIERRGLASDAPEASTDVVELRNFIAIRQFRDLPEALIAEGILKSAGIECYLSDDNIVRMHWFLSNVMGGVKLHVKPEDAEAAREVLEQPAPEGFEVEGIGQFEQPRCPKCNSMEIAFEELNKPVAFATAYFGVPIPLHRKGWKCRSCGQAWLEDANLE